MFSHRFTYFIGLLVLTTITAWSDSTDRHLQVIENPVILPVSIERTKDCPYGLELVGKNCVSTQILKPSFVCPPSTTDVNDTCVSFAQAFRSCPENCPRAGEKCICTSRVAAAPVCDVGQIVGNQCRIETDVPPTCPVDFQLQDGQCLRYSSQNLICPTGYQLQGEQCMKRVRWPAAPVCPAQYSRADDGICIQSIPVPSRCDADFSLIGSECIKTVPRVLAPCPNSFTPSGKSCFQEQQAVPRSVCPVNFILDSQQCIQETPTPSTCPQGTTRGSTDQCEHSINKQPVCSASEELIYGQCRQSSTSDSELKCPNRYSLDGTMCKHVHMEIPHHRCSHGTLQDGQCVSQSSTPTRLQCPSGYQVDKAFRCVRDVPNDCFEEDETVMHRSARKFSKLRQLHPNYKAKVTSPSSFSVNKRTTEQHTCMRVDAVPVQYVCPNGSPPQGKTCTIVSRHTPQIYCKVGTLDQALGQCVTESIAPATAVCTRGHLQPDGQCLETIDRPPQLICPGASQDTGDRCVVVVPEVRHPDTVTRRNPESLCDVGVLRGQVCITTERIARAEVCPAGSEERSGDCIVAGPVITPEPFVVTRSAQYICSDGGAAADKTCYTTEIVPAERVCPNHGLLSESRCIYTAALLYHPIAVTHISARLTCPSEYQRLDSYCSLTQSELPRLDCPPGFNRFKEGRQECIRSHQRIPVCPPGAAQVGGDCVKKSYVPPRVKEIKVCTKGQPGC